MKQRVPLEATGFFSRHHRRRNSWRSCEDRILHRSGFPDHERCLHMIRIVHSRKGLPKHKIETRRGAWSYGYGFHRDRHKPNSWRMGEDSSRHSSSGPHHDMRLDWTRIISIKRNITGLRRYCQNSCSVIRDWKIYGPYS